MAPQFVAVAQAKWIEGRIARVLPIPYFHVVFTLPAELRPLAAYNRRQVFGLLFGAASATLLELGHDPKRLGAELGITMVLHTRARDLSFHPHIHAIVTDGGLSPDGKHWIPSRHRYLFPIAVIKALFRDKFLALLDAAIGRGEITMPGGAAADPEAWEHLRDRLYRKPSHVYAKRPFGGAEQVIAYLGRYTHRVGISNQRLMSMDNRGITFRTKDGKTATVLPDAFLRRFLQHVLPSGFVKIRHYGLMASGNATTKLEVARKLLPTPRPCNVPKTQATDDESLTLDSARVPLTGFQLRRCPVCGANAIVRQPLPNAQARAPPVAA
jgi:hypothetical protein